MCTDLLLIVSVGVALGVFLGGLLLVCISRKMKRLAFPNMYSASQTYYGQTVTHYY